MCEIGKSLLTGHAVEFLQHWEGVAVGVGLQQAPERRGHDWSLNRVLDVRVGREENMNFA